MGRLQLLVPVLILVLLATACRTGTEDRDPALDAWALATCQMLVEYVGSFGWVGTLEDELPRLTPLRQEYFDLLGKVERQYEVAAGELSVLTPPPGLSDKHLALMRELGDFGRVAEAASVTVVQSTLEEIYAIVDALILDEEEVRRDAGRLVASFPTAARAALENQPGCDPITTD